MFVWGGGLLNPPKSKTYPLSEGEFKLSSTWDDDLDCFKSECLMCPEMDVV